MAGFQATALARQVQSARHDHGWLEEVALTSFVLVPGAWHGGWVYAQVADGLRAEGHEAYSLTLTGVGERAHLLGATTNLDTHVQDVVAVLEAEQLEQAVLCGHSYAGMVISGAAERAANRIGGLVYIDAYVPSDGDSCWRLTTDAFREIFVRGARPDGCSVTPPAGLDPRVTAHPLASFMQRIRLAGAHEQVSRRDFIYLSGWRATPFTETYERLREDPDWHTHVLPTAHDVMARAPGSLVEILLEAGTRG
jgi:pimeloyl-ACP methyl ester carboxylesterase